MSLVFVIFLGAGVDEKPASGKVTGSDQIKIDFEKTVIPILRQSCFPCHVPAASMPSVSSDITRKIRKEVAKAQGDFEMGAEFPFSNENKVKKQLDLLGKEIKEKKMPPESQKKLSLGLPLSDVDRKILLRWVEDEKKARK